MTELLTTTPDRPKRRNGAARDALVSGSALATHLGMTRQNVSDFWAAVIRDLRPGLQPIPD